MSNMPTAVSTADTFQEQLAIATHLAGSARDLAYDHLMSLAAPALQEVATTELPNACVLLFDTNYTDEGASLYFTGYRDAKGTTYPAGDTSEAAMIDEIVFVVTGGAETGSGIPGMRPTTPGKYELHVLANL